MNPAQHILVGLVQLYRWTLSPAKSFLFGPTTGCRFTPSCAEYAQQAVREHGAARGSWLTARRICRCHPWGGCGHDPVPESVGQASRLSPLFDMADDGLGNGLAHTGARRVNDLSGLRQARRLSSE